MLIVLPLPVNTAAKGPQPADPGLVLGVPTEVAGPCAEAPAYKFLELRVLSLFVCFGHKAIVKPTALGPVANTDTTLLIDGLFQKGRVLAQDGVRFCQHT